MKYIGFIALFISVFGGSELLAQASKGQEFYDGWALTRKGDTLKGKICYENSKTGEIYDKIFFMDATGQKKRYGTDKLSAFGCNGKVFEYVQLPFDDAPPPLLMQKVIEGDITLYKTWFKNENSTAQKFVYDADYFLKKKDQEQFVEVNDLTSEKAFRKQMKELFEGDEQILEMIKENKWTVNDLEKIVNAYNALE